MGKIEIEVDLEKLDQHRGKVPRERWLEGLVTRRFRMLERSWLCCDCGKDDPTTYAYMLGEIVWASVARKDEILCLDCIVKRLGRPLTLEDLADVPMNEIFRRMHG